MSDTPRTDAVAESTWQEGEVVCAEFARQLERELNELKKLLYVASCPSCDGSGAKMVGSYEQPEVEQCQWCFEKNLLVTKKDTL